MADLPHICVVEICERLIVRKVRVFYQGFRSHGNLQILIIYNLLVLQELQHALEV
jgi:hypothetical protein